MKQITKTPQIVELLAQSLGAGVDTSNLAVYEAIALNNRPIRKNHPIYKGARADRSLLLEMAAALAIESRPLQLEHMGGDLPQGRVFHGRVLDKGSESELRVLFFVDSTEERTISKLNSGTLDQVSVSVIPKKLLNSKSGFDYLGPQAKPENVWTGADLDGNIIGKDGVHARMVGLELWTELSLVGMGGAENARVINHNESYFGSSYSKLAASGTDPSIFVLEATTENTEMDLKELVESLTATTTKLALTQRDLDTVTASLTAKDTEIATLKAQLADAGKPSETLAAAQTSLAEKTTEVETLTASNAVAVAALQTVAKHILTASGKPTADVPSDVAKLDMLIKDSSAALTAALSAGGRGDESQDDAEKPIILNLAAFRRQPQSSRR